MGRNVTLPAFPEKSADCAEEAERFPIVSDLQSAHSQPYHRPPGMSRHSNT